MSGRLKKLVRLNSIRTSMILSFMALISVIVLCLSVASYSYTINDFESLSISYTSQLLDEINSSIDAYIDNMKSMATVVVENEDVRWLMAYYNRYNGVELTALQMREQEALKQRAVTHMNIVANTRGDITNIAVISKYRDVVLSDPIKEVNDYSGYNVTDWYLRPLSYKDDIFVSPSHVQSLIDGEYRWVISISKAILDPETGEVTGTMVIDLNYHVIESICENVDLDHTGYIYLIDGKKNLIYHPQQPLIYSGIKSEDFQAALAMDPSQPYARVEGGEKIILRNTSGTTGWSAVGVINPHNLIRDRSAIIRFYVMLAYIAIIVAAIVAVLISTSITNPVKKLEKTMHKVEQGDLTIQADTGLKNEIGHLSRSFNSMIVKLRQLMQSIVRNEEEKRRSEILALQAQINPHFLYNTLDTIIWMSASGKNDQVVEVTSALAHLFQTSLSQSDSLVELDVEIQNIESYLTIQKMRYKDKLSFRIAVPPQVRGLMTPKLILQPIVENAVYHGVKQNANGGSIEIGATLEDGELTLVVQDDGVGMTQEQIDHIFDPRADDSRGIGVRNVHNRIKLVFGEQYGLSYQSAQGAGTRAAIRIPAVERGNFPDAN